MAEASFQLRNQNESATRFGYRYGPKGTHTTRTMMLKKFVMLLESVPPTGTADDDSDAAVERNATGKKTSATRNTIQRLRELHSLDLTVPLFRVLRRLWSIDPVGRKESGILRWDPKIKWTKDRGKEPKRTRDEYPWFRGWDEQTIDFPGTDTPIGDRWNDGHYTNAFKQAARNRK